MMRPSTSPPKTDAHNPPTALISGASFAGLATAFWLHRLGYQVTVIEAAPDLRCGGTPIDLGGEAMSVLYRMGLRDAVLAKALPPRVHEFKRIDDTIVLAPPADDDDDQERHYEVHRSDLLDILSSAVADPVEILFSRTITSLKQRSDAVDVTFSDGTSLAYALVFGCDGNRSNTRKLAFDDDGRFNHFLGAYCYCKNLSTPVLVPENKTEVVTMVGRMLMLNGYANQTDVIFGFRSDDELHYDYTNVDEKRAIIHERFDDLAWKVPEMLVALDQEGDFYFDRMTQIRMPSWSRGRIVLVGDAGYCVSPFAGFGGSIALIGAGRLANAMTRHPRDHEAAFRDYETGLRPFIDKVQAYTADDGLLMLLPATEAELVDRDRRLIEGDLRPFDDAQAEQ